MARKGHTVKYAAEELARLKVSKGAQSDWSAAAAMTTAQIEANVAADSDEEGMVMDWENASVTLSRWGGVKGSARMAEKRMRFSAIRKKSS